MNKISLTILCVITVISVKSQAWETNLNHINAGDPNYFGTSTSEPINFYTDGTKKMELSRDGILNLNTYSGIGNRFLQVDVDGNLFPWVGNAGNASKILFGDNTWKVYPFLMNGSNPYVEGGRKFGIATSEPLTELDVNGGAQINDALRVGEGIYVGPKNNYGLIRYTPGQGDFPSVFSFGGGGESHPSNPNPGLGYNSFNNGHGGGQNDPPADLTCINGETVTINTLSLFQEMICVQNTLGTPHSIGNLNMGHNGYNAFLESQGTNTASPNAGDLLINERCNRNVYVFNGAKNFSQGVDKVMSVAGRVNVTQNMQIGGGTSATSFQQNMSMLYVNTPGDKATGIRVRHAGGADAGIRIVELSNVRKALVISNGAGGGDGTELFSVLGDGKTQINTTNAQALSIKNAATNSENFSVLTDGKTYINTSNIQAFGIKSTGNNYESFLVNTDGKTEIKTTNTKAFSIANASNNNNETFSVDKNGYTEINIYSPFTLPDQVNNVGRVLAIKDKVANKDIFVVKQNGKTYAREVEISLVTNFPDYVFNKDYDLRSIPELDKYISSNKHLPGFEKGEHYEKNGINVNDMIIKQQEKIEELTLYIIQLEKRLQLIENK